VPFFYPAFHDVNAAEPEVIPPFNPDFHATLERISPVSIAYYRLKAVLKTRANERAVPFVLPTISQALSNPLSLPVVARGLTERDGFQMAEVKSEDVLRKFASKIAATFSMEPDCKAPPEFSASEVKEPFSMATLMDRMVSRMVQAGFCVTEAFSSISLEEKARFICCVDFPCYPTFSPMIF